MQIALITTERDEADFAQYVTECGGKFLPSSYPSHPLPILSLPLPARMEPYCGEFCIWFEDVFSEEELVAESKIPFNPANGCYQPSVLPVLTFCRDYRDGKHFLPGRLHCGAMVCSFRFGRKPAEFTDEDTKDFRQRLKVLVRYYRKLCRWVAKNWKLINRGTYLGVDAAREVEAGRLVLPWTQR